MNSLCPQCHALVDPIAPTCPSCSLDLRPPPRRAALEPRADDPDREPADLLAALVAGTTRDDAAPRPPRPLVPAAAVVTRAPTPVEDVLPDLPRRKRRRR